MGSTLSEQERVRRDVFRLSPEVRLPLVRVSMPVEKEIESAMRHAELFG